MTLQKVSSQHNKGSKWNEISISKLKRMMIRMINEMKEDIQKQISKVRKQNK
jgi:hypothetical protein